MRIYTDASTKSHSGIAFVITNDHDVELYYGSKVVHEPDNNTAELLAIEYGLENAPKRQNIMLFTDSTYAIYAIKTNTCREWEKSILYNIKNLLNNRKFSIYFVKGHNDDGTVFSFFNRFADSLANNARKRFITCKRIAKHKKAVRARFKNKKRENYTKC